MENVVTYLNLNRMYPVTVGDMKALIRAVPNSPVAKLDHVLVDNGQGCRDSSDNLTDESPIGRESTTVFFEEGESIVYFSSPEDFDIPPGDRWVLD